MWQVEQPPLAVSSPPAIYVVAKELPAKSGAPHKLGVCQTMRFEQESIRPMLDAGNYMSWHLKKTMDFLLDSEGNRRADTKVRIVKQPQHGNLAHVGERWDNYSYNYVLDDDEKQYVGNDSFVIEVTAAGETVTIFYRISVNVGQPVGIEGPGGTQIADPKRCPRGESWKISQSDFNPGTQDYAAWLRSSELSTLLADASKSLTGFQDLAGSAVGNTDGEGANAAITLDSTAAGHNWYVDATPLDNTDDYLPTSNPNIWQAKAGSDAAGKMDLLSVLLHEYGHALGLEHSADSGDYMAATLQPGQRRLPNADELTLMSQLVAQLKASTALANGSTPTDPTSPTVPNPSLPKGALLSAEVESGKGEMKTAMN